MRARSEHGLAHNLRSISAVIGTVVLGGCSAVPPASEIDPSVSARTFQERRVDDAAFAALTDGGPTCTSRCAWDLDHLTLMAWKNDAGLVEGRAAWSRAEAEVDKEDQRPNPILSTGSEYNRDAGSGPSPWLLSAALEFTFETAGKRPLRVATAEAGVDEHVWAYALRVGDVRQRVREARLDVSRSEQKVSLSARIAALHSEREKLILRRVQSGSLARPEAYPVERDALNAAAEKLRSDAASKQARVALAAALSVPVSAVESALLAELPPIDPDEAAVSSQQLRLLGVENRADLAQALASYRRADAMLRLEVARKTPDLAIGPGLIFDQGDKKFSLGANLIAPLFDQNQYGIAIAAAARNEAAAHFVTLQTDAFGEIETARARLLAALESLRLLSARQGHDEEVLRQTRARFTAGSIDRLELIDAELLLLQAGQLLADEQAETCAAFAQMERVIQRPVWPASQLIAPTGPDAGQERSVP